MIRVFIADDHAVVRHGIEQIIGETSDIAVSGEAQHVNEILESMHKSPADILVLDISMQDRAGLDALEAIKREFPTIPVLVLSIHPEVQYAVRAMRAGASGYIEKTTSAAELLKAIRAVSTGRKYMSPSMMDSVASGIETDTTKPLHQSLSAREMQVLLMIAQGKRTQSIATELSLNSRTVDTYRTRILFKMHMATNADMVRYSMEQGLVD